MSSPSNDRKNPKANEYQPGGDHYKRVEGEQHWDRLVRLCGGIDNCWPYFAFQATAYLERYRFKHEHLLPHRRHEERVKDLKKAIHYTQKLLELEEAGYKTTYEGKSEFHSWSAKVAVPEPSDLKDDESFKEYVNLVEEVEVETKEVYMPVVIGDPSTINFDGPPPLTQADIDLLMAAGFRPVVRDDPDQSDEYLEKSEGPLVPNTPSGTDAQDNTPAEEVVYHMRNKSGVGGVTLCQCDDFAQHKIIVTDTPAKVTCMKCVWIMRLSSVSNRPAAGKTEEKPKL